MSKAFTAVALIFLFADLWCVEARAQAFDGVHETALVVEGIDNDAKKCGIRPDDIASAVSQALGSKGYKLLKSPKANFLYVNLIVLAEGNNCMGSVQFSIDYTAKWFPVADTAVNGLLSICNAGNLVSEKAAKFPETLKAILADVSGKTIECWETYPIR